MKIWELKEGVEYIAYDKNFGKRNYKIVDGEFLYFDDDDRWSLSLRKFKELNELDFTECTPPIDWSKVPVDTKILVRDRESQEWIKRHLAMYTYNRVYTWNEGKTSFTALDYSDIISWNQAKLYKEE